MNITTKKNPTKAIKKTDPGFYINDGITISPRAGFEISQGCPREFRLIIDECLRNGWLKPVAYMTDREMMISGLLKDE